MAAARPHHIARRLLEMERGVALCDACLALTCGTSLTAMRSVTEALVRSGGEFERTTPCESGRRTVPSPRHTAETTKCSQCRLPCEAGDGGVLIEGERFHARCLLSVITDETIRLSRSLSERSRELIEQSRRRLRRTGYSWMPLDSGP